jgi:DNA-directed RNA polymerase specialized sigma24 family protein
MEQLYLNDLYSQYSEKKIKRCEFEGMLFQYLIKNQEKTCLSHWKYDEYEDFLSWFYSDIHRAIDIYLETGASFESYISTVMRTAAKKYRITTSTNRLIEYSAWSVHVPELYVFEETPVYSYECQEDAISKIIHDHRGRKNPKQLLALILKCYYYISDDFLDRIALNTGIDREMLKEMIDKIRAIRQKKDDEIFLMKERIYCQYYRCIVYEKRLLYTPENSAAYLKLKKQSERSRERLENMRKRFSNVRTDASNREIAEAIGVTKGTVDATFYKLRTRLDIKIDKSILN